MAEFKTGTTVKVTQLPPYLKTADPMPMLRPADLLAVGDVGVLGDRRPGGYWAVKFPRGSFLLEDTYLTVAPEMKND
ncbi:SipA [[Synechococcus] sp. NIES-970]|nr:SipA [[Synechococcus] sp. NIES-970]